ncbi:sigma factor SigF [Synechococcus sp. WH 5701]|nr:sigma factor SigF [Synechococcus sp. WH 5701]
MEHPLQHQLAQAGIEPLQPALQPALVLAFAAEGIPLVIGAAGIRQLPGRQALQQRVAPLLPIAGGGIEAAQPQGLMQLQRLAPALRRAAQGRSQLLLPQRRQLAMLTLLQQGLATPVQLAQLTGAAQRLLVVTQVVLHLPADVEHSEAAQGGVARRIKGLDRADQPEAAQLHQIVERHPGAPALTHGHLAHQGQIQLHQPVAQAVVTAAVKALQQLGIAAVEVLVLVGLGSWIGHGGDSGGSVFPPSAAWPRRRFTPSGEPTSPRWVIDPVDG